MKKTLVILLLASFTWSCNQRNEDKLKKKNSVSYKPIIDLYIIVENSDGEKVVLSCGEILKADFFSDRAIKAVNTIYYKSHNS